MSKLTDLGVVASQAAELAVNKAVVAVIAAKESEAASRQLWLAVSAVALRLQIEEGERLRAAIAAEKEK